jgi:hypothetical protein
MPWSQPRSREVRADVKADELASYCVHALQAASDLTDEAAVERLVAVVTAGLLPPAPEPDQLASRAPIRSGS